MYVLRCQEKELQYSQIQLEGSYCHMRSQNMPDWKYKHTITNNKLISMDLKKNYFLTRNNAALTKFTNSYAYK